ncbi:MAG TPA: alkaline phosphatase, partial [Thermoguttaceae bacterium]|nr:alkaline phosphatase [Thermoguttaceae bacterium]
MEQLEHRRLLSVAPKNVILMIGDGMGPEQVKAANYYAGGDLVFETFPYQGEVTTAPFDGSIPDSASAATAFATGQKVNVGVVSVALPGDGSDLPTSLEYYQGLGKATGLVSTASMTDATPAAFAAHAASRANETEIADDFLTQTRPNIILGGGSAFDATGDSEYTVVTNTAEMQALDLDAETQHISGQFDSGNMPYEYDGLGLLPHLTEMTATALDL